MRISPRPVCPTSDNSCYRQTKETEVYCYYAVDTVEQNILDIAARKGTSLYTVDNASSAVNLASSAVIEKQTIEAVSKDKSMLKGDFVCALSFRNSMSI